MCVYTEAMNTHTEKQPLLTLIDARMSACVTRTIGADVAQGAATPVLLAPGMTVGLSTLGTLYTHTSDTGALPLYWRSQAETVAYVTRWAIGLDK